MLATAMKILHFRSFIEKHPSFSDELKSIFVEAQLSPTVELLEKLEQNDEFRILISLYKEYTKETSNGAG